MSTYSFLSVNAALVGPGGAISLGAGSGNAEEGIDVEPSTEINTMTIGADGSVMHSLNANKSGKVTIRLLKTSPVNQQVQALYNYQTANPAFHGQNTLSIADSARGDVVTCQAVAFNKDTPLKYAKDGSFNEWIFDAGVIERVLGAGV